jgi:hypothetical protein
MGRVMSTSHREERLRGPRHRSRAAVLYALSSTSRDGRNRARIASLKRLMPLAGSSLHDPVGGT